ncbi:hypothetical protein ACLOJK_033076 [Asimina triloba]
MPLEVWQTANPPVVVGVRESENGILWWETRTSKKSKWSLAIEKSESMVGTRLVDDYMAG